MASSEELFRRIVGDERNGFWLTLLRYLLWVCSLIYGLAVWLWLLGYRWRLFRRSSLTTKVISVGNITLGGTGKTPLVALLARILQEREKRVAVLSRGYRRRGKGIKIISDGKKILSNPQEAGDEPYLLAKSLRNIPVIVGKDRVQAGRLTTEKFASEILLLDDGFQYLKLRRDLDIAVIDAANPFGNGHLLPRGILREPLSSLKRAHLFCLTRVDQARKLGELENRLNTLNPKTPIVECIHSPCFLRKLPDGPQVGLERLSGRRVVAFSAVGNPEGFEQSLVKLGAQLVGRMRFKDHHRYSVKDLERIARLARNSQAQMVVTTGKDSVNLSQTSVFDIEMWSLEIEIQVVRGLEYLSEAIG
ncbi:MAG: tetraacyldisaccharide 4'-kinase [Candidatus Latescibacteria bacterium]|nr:tetraacyldisaccharide 4'-kinase [Candidatus Latescibacterota bacterium]